MENRKYIRETQATNDGIIYFSGEPNKACMTYISAYGKLERTLLVLENPSVFNPILPKQEIEKNFNYPLTLIISCVLITLAALSQNIHLFLAASSFSLFVALPLFKLMNVIFRIKITKEYSIASKYINGYFNFLQVFVTSKPSNKELIVAIEGLRNYEF